MSTSSDDPRRDDSWKEAARKEKEQLDEKVKADEKQAAQREYPPANFVQHVGDLGLQAMLALGLIGPEDQTERPVDLGAARYVIDTIAILQDKTRGNLGDEESAHVESLISTLRMQFIEVSKRARSASTGPSDSASADSSATDSGPKIILEDETQ